MQKSEFNLDKQDEQHSTSDINQLACCLKNAIFSKYIFNYLIEKVDEVKNKILFLQFFVFIKDVEFI
jgi:hypothetical protein